MNPWKTLQIEPTEDKKAIKKAYAQLIKKHRPDEDPQKFQEIQEAYQMALKWSLWAEEEFEDGTITIETSDEQRPELTPESFVSNKEDSFEVNNSERVEETRVRHCCIRVRESN